MIQLSTSKINCLLVCFTISQFCSDNNNLLLSLWLVIIIMTVLCVPSGLLNALMGRSDKRKMKKRTAVLSLLLPLLMSSVFLAAGIPHLALYHDQEAYNTPARSGRTLMHWNNRIININDKVYVVGYIFGVFSAGFYVFARIPQIIKNVRRLFSSKHCLSLSLSLSLSLTHTHTHTHTHSY